jgi:hypothetical protein
LRAGNFKVEDLIKDTQKLSTYLKSAENLRLTDTQVNAFFETGLNMQKIHDILFGIEALIPNGKAFNLFNFMEQNGMKNSKIWLVFAWIFDIFNKGDLTVDVSTFSKEAVDILITKDTVKAFFCHNNSLSFISSRLRPNDSYVNEYKQISNIICSKLNDNQLEELTNKFRENFDERKIEELLSKEWNYKIAKKRINQFFEDLNKFALFELTLKELSQISVSLPNDVCNLDNHTNNTNVENDLKDYKIDSKNGTSKSENSSNSESYHHKRRNNVEGLVRVFLKMQKTLCGSKTIDNSMENKTTNNETKSTDGKENKNKDNSDEEPINSFIKEQHLLLQMLYSNPTVLFAPNNTNSAAHKIIQKANETFELLDKVSNYAHILYNVSSEIENYLNLDSTKIQFETVKKIRKELLHLPKIFNFLDLGHGLELLNRSISIGGDLDTFISQLKLIHNAACSWLTLTKDVMNFI